MKTSSLRGDSDREGTCREIPRYGYYSVSSSSVDCIFAFVEFHWTDDLCTFF